VKALHDTVRLSTIESKQEMKPEYDRRHSAKTPDFEIGQKVLLKDVRIFPGSNKVLTKRPYSLQLYIIKQIIQSHGAGPAYKLTDLNKAQDLRGLTAHDRLKHFNVPKTTGEKVTASFAIIAEKPCFKPADRILQESIVGEEKFLVQFQSRELRWLPKSSIRDRLLYSYLQRQNKYA